MTARLSVSGKPSRVSCAARGDSSRTHAPRIARTAHSSSVGNSQKPSELAVASYGTVLQPLPALLVETTVQKRTSEVWPKGLQPQKADKLSKFGCGMQFRGQSSPRNGKKSRK
eukprot:4541420-Amphidinium_carterae.2